METVFISLTRTNNSTEQRSFVVKMKLAMARARQSMFLAVFILLCPLLIPTAGEYHFHRKCRKHRNPSPPPLFFIFGDSFFDPGNNNYINTTTLDKANFLPYGETYFNFPTGRFSDGRLISDFIAEYAKLPYIPPFLQPGNHSNHTGINFASAGAGALAETFQGAVIDIKTQLSYFMKVNAGLRHNISSAVYLFSIGTNDYLSIFLTNSTTWDSFSHQVYVDMVIGNLTTVVKTIYEAGGRKFGFLNLGDLGCSPGMRLLNPQRRSCYLGEASILAKLHNQALHKSLLKMDEQLPGFKYSLYDFNRALKLRMNSPSQFGLKEGKAACCGTGKFRGIFSCGGKRLVKEYDLCENPEEYVFWDSYHLTEEVYKQMAAEMWSGSAHVLGPYNLNKLVIG